MGFYTSFELDVQLSQDTPEGVLAVIQFCLGQVPEENMSKEWIAVAAGPGMSADGFHHMLNSGGAIATERGGKSRLDGLQLTVTTSTKSYGYIVRTFLEFLSPYVADFVPEKCRLWNDDIPEDEAVPIVFPFDSSKMFTKQSQPHG